jgi:hypothetical protein
MTVSDVLLASLRAQIRPEAAAWLDAARRVAAVGPLTQLLRAYTEASRHLGRAPLVLAPGDRVAVPELARVPASHLTREDAGRLLLLLSRYSALQESGPNCAAAAIDCYQQGDTGEQQSWLRTVALLPDPACFLPVVIDACRTSIVPLFEAVACENPYPAQYFPALNFNQVVLKALFNGIALNRIVDLPSRLSPELSRMASDYADERRAAGRSIPTDITLAMLPGLAAQRTEQ